jgi:hypothetical protein
MGGKLFSGISMRGLPSRKYVPFCGAGLPLSRAFYALVLAGRSSLLGCGGKTALWYLYVVCPRENMLLSTAALACLLAEPFKHMFLLGEEKLHGGKLLSSISMRGCPRENMLLSAALACLLAEPFMHLFLLGEVACFEVGGKLFSRISMWRCPRENMLLSGAGPAFLLAEPFKHMFLLGEV